MKFDSLPQCVICLVRLSLMSLAAGMLSAASPMRAGESSYQVGVGRVDITPDYPVRMSGYLARPEEAAGFGQRIWAKALAIGTKAAEPFLLITVDNCALPASLREEVLHRLAPLGVSTERFALSFTHTHSAPCVTGALVNIFSADLPPEQQARVDRYTRQLAGWLEQAGRAALADRKPARLEWEIGKAGFAFNRRTPGGPVDHDLPVLAVKSPDGSVRAILASYATHCTTLGADYKLIHGDWAGSAQLAIESDHPGATALIAIGCGAECNPLTDRARPSAERIADADRHGRTIADEVKRLLAEGLRSVTGAPVARVKELNLPLDPLPGREEWEARARENATAYHARKNLARLDRGEKLPTHVPYLVQAWSFGRDLAMVFLPGEVVGDYSLRLKKELDDARLWVNAYTNDAPAYIPSRRVLDLGGYEAVTSLRYYDLPARFSREIEEMIVSAVHEVVPREFLAAEHREQLRRRSR